MASFLTLKQFGCVSLSALSAIVLVLWENTLVHAQVRSAEDRTNTRVRTNGEEFLIDGGRTSQDRENLFHSFRQFDLDRGEIANFLSDPQVRNILGRVVGGDPSLINGLLRVTGSNANLYLINPSGIIFGADARLDLSGSFFATTADRVQFGDRWFNAIGNNNYDLLLGDPSAFSFALNNPGSIINAGELSVLEGEALALVGGNVINTGDLEAPGGQILITAVPGENLIRLSQPGNVLSLDIQPLRNTGDVPSFDPLSLPALLTVGAPLELDATVTRNREVQLTESEVTLPRVPGMAIASGTLDVSTADSSTSQTPTIAVLGDRVGLLGVSLDASTRTGGGNIYVGGDYQGQGDLPTAQGTLVSEDSVLNADARNRGDGGNIIVWADGITAFYGNASVQGGLTFGNGGLVEVSGREHLIFSGNVNLSAINGDFGTLLLDPQNIVISNSASSPSVDAALPAIFASNFPNQDITINTVELGQQTGNIILEATNNITISDNIAFSEGIRINNGRTLIPGGAISFIADADNNGEGIFQMPIQSLITAPGRPISISGAEINVGTINTRTGSRETNTRPRDVELNAYGDIVTGTIDVYGDELTPANSGNILIVSRNGSIDTTAGVLSANSGEGNAGYIELRARGNINTARISNVSVNEGGTNRGITIVSEEGSVNLSYAASLPDTLGQLNLSGLESTFNADAGNIRVEAPEGSITLSTFISGSSGGEVTFRSPSIYITAPINLETGEIIGDDPVGRINTDANTVVFGGDVNGDVPLEIDAIATNFDFRGSIGNNSLIPRILVDAAQVNLNGSVSTNNGPITFNSPISLSDSSTFDAGIGDVTLSRRVTGNRLDIISDQATLAGELDLNELNLQVDDLDLQNILRVDQDLTIEPQSDRDIVISNADVPGALNLSPAEIALFQGNGLVTLGQVGATQAIRVLDNVTVNFPINFAPGSGTVQLSANVSTIDQDLSLSNTFLNSDVQLNAGTGNLSLDGLTTGRNQLDIVADEARLSGNLNVNELNLEVNDLDLQDTLTVDSRLTIQPQDNQDIRISESDRTGALNLSPTEIARLQGNGIVTLGEVGAGQAIQVLDDVRFNVSANFIPGDGEVELGANITTARQDLSISNAVLTSDVQLNTRTGNIALDGITAGRHQLDVRAGQATLSGELNFRELNLRVEDLELSNLLTTDQRLTLRPQSDRDIVISRTDVPGALNLSPDEIALLRGNGLITLGRIQEDQAIRVLDNAEFNVPVEFAPGNGTVQLSANVSTTNQDLSLSNTVLNSDVQLSAGTDNLSLNGLATGSNQLNIFANEATLSGDLNVNDLNLQVNDLDLQNRLTLNSNLTIQPQDNQNIRITESDQVGALNLSPTEIARLRGTGTVNLGEVGAGQAIQVLDDVRFNVSANFIPGDGEVELGANITTARQDLSISNAVLTSDVQLNTRTGNITLNGVTAGRNQLDVRAGLATLSGNSSFQELNLNVDDLEISNNLTVSNSLNLRPRSERDIAISDNARDGALNLTPDEVARIQGDGLATVGPVESDRAIRVIDDVTFNVPANLAPGDGTVRLSADITTTGENLSVGRAILNNDVQLDTGSGVGDISFTESVDSRRDNNYQLSLAAGTGDIQLTGDVGERNQLQAIEFESANAILLNGNLNVTEDLSFEQPLVLTDSATLRSNGVEFNSTVQSQNRETNNLEIIPGDGDVQFNGEVGTPSRQQLGSITIRDGNELTTNADIQAESLRFLDGDGDVTLNSDVTTTGGPVNITTDGNIAAQNITTNGGNINLDSSSARDSIINTGNLNSSDPAGGGDVNIEAREQITTGNINASAVAGDGGDVALDPRSNIEVGFINTQSELGNGGNITAETRRFFLATESFDALSGISASLSAEGGAGGGDITISHFGGRLLEAFNVTNLVENGTVGAITTGTPNDPNPITSGQFPGPFDQLDALGDIRLITQPFPDVISDIEEPDSRLFEEPPDELQDDLVFLIEAYMTNQVERYFSSSGTPIKSLEQVQEDLRRIYEETGVKPAVIYAYFAPRHIEGIDDHQFLIQPNSFQEDPALGYQLHLLLVTPDEAPVLVRNVALREEVLREAESFPVKVNTYANEMYVGSAQRLYNWLIDPLENYEGQNVLQERGIQNLVFIADVGLRSLPLAALYNGDRYLIETYSVGYMPSMSLTDTRYRDIRTLDVLAMGTDQFESNSPSLPAVPLEIQFIQQLYQGRSRVLLYTGFTEENLRSQYALNPTGIVHLGTHGVFEPDSPQDSYIEFVNERLTLDEVRSLRLNRPPAELLVLSACQTARGNEDVELGFAGLAYQLGVKSVLAGVIDLPDNGTLGLITQFYSRLQDSPIKAETLRQAQLSMLRGEVTLENGILVGPGLEEGLPLSEGIIETSLSFTHPAFWAGFTLVGNPW